MFSFFLVHTGNLIILQLWYFLKGIFLFFFIDAGFRFVRKLYLSSFSYPRSSRGIFICFSLLMRGFNFYACSDRDKCWSAYMPMLIDAPAFLIITDFYCWLFALSGIYWRSLLLPCSPAAPYRTTHGGHSSFLCIASPLSPASFLRTSYSPFAWSFGYSSFLFPFSVSLYQQSDSYDQHTYT